LVSTSQPDEAVPHLLGKLRNLTEQKRSSQRQ